jgi:hypothetical protein
MIPSEKDAIVVHMLVDVHSCSVVVDTVLQPGVLPVLEEAAVFRGFEHKSSVLPPSHQQFLPSFQKSRNHVLNISTFGHERIYRHLPPMHRMFRH